MPSQGPCEDTDHIATLLCAGQVATRTCRRIIWGQARPSTVLRRVWLGEPAVFVHMCYKCFDDPEPLLGVLSLPSLCLGEGHNSSALGLLSR